MLEVLIVPNGGAYTLIPALGKLRQENYHEFKVSLGYMRLCLKSKQANKGLGRCFDCAGMSRDPQHLKIKSGCGPRTPVILVLSSRDGWIAGQSKL